MTGFFFTNACIPDKSTTDQMLQSCILENGNPFRKQTLLPHDNQWLEDVFPIEIVPF